MSDIAIAAEGLSKQYLIGRQTQASDALRHRIEDALRNPMRWLRRAKSGSQSDREPFWALNDVSFEINRGETVGIIGRNGAGKSTLLKILSRITEPTKGRIRLRGRVASLLEVGTGFHQELTGRENIYLNGAILGMTRSEITRKFDAIVAFSEVEKFLDTPVKRYSSGMYIRLAFAVAAHVEPEILIVDEVLAVGDIAFQQKCLGKMGDVARGGRTVLFVSHNMAALQGLCPQSMLLEDGRLVGKGSSEKMIGQYLRGLSTNNAVGAMRRSGTGALRIQGVHLEDLQGGRLAAVRNGMDFEVVLTYASERRGQVLRRVDPGISFHLADTTLLSVIYASYVGQMFDEIPSSGEMRFRFRKFPLREGRYLLGARVMVGGEEADWPQEPVGHLDVVAGDFYQTGSNGFEGNAPLLLMADCRVN